MKQFARTATLAAIVGLGALLPALAGAEAVYPSKPIRVIVPSRPAAPPTSLPAPSPTRWARAWASRW